MPGLTYLISNQKLDLMLSKPNVRRFCFFFFFFQAEDGIRHDLVTGVQTCALPISTRVERHDGGLGPAGKIIAEQALAGAGWAQGVARMVVLDHHPPAEAGKGE